jgi:hypothetical protein
VYTVEASATGKTFRVMDSDGHETIWNRFRTAEAAQARADQLNESLPQDTDAVSEKERRVARALRDARAVGPTPEEREAHRVEKARTFHQRYGGALTPEGIVRRGAMPDDLAPIHIPALVVLHNDVAGRGMCDYSFTHNQMNIPATGSIHCGPLGDVPACRRCVEFVRAQERR